MAELFDKATLVDRLSDGAAVCTKEGALLYANRALARTLGLDLDRLLAKNLSEFADRKVEWTALVSLLEQGGDVQDYEMKFKRDDGMPISASLSASFLDVDHNSSSISIVFRDISTRKGVENDLREKAFRIDIMNRIARLMSAEKDVRQQALASAVQELKKLFDFEVVSIGISPEHGRHVEVIDVYPGGLDPKAQGQKVPVEGSIVEQLRFGRNAVIIGKDAGNKLFSELSVMNLRMTSSLLAVPLMSRGKIFGSLTIAHSRQNQYNLENADVLRTVADQIAGLVDNMLLVASLQERITLQDTLVRTGVELQRAINTEQIYAAIASNMREVVDYSELSFYLIDWQKGAVLPAYAVGPWAEEVMAAPGTLDQGIVGIVARSGTAEFVDDVDTDPRSSEVPGAALSHDAMLAVPLKGPDGVMGVLELYRPMGRVFTIGDLEAGKMFAQQASVALHNSNLVSRLQEAKREIEMLNDLMFHDINNFNFATMNYIQAVAGSSQLADQDKVHLEKSLHLIRQTADLIESVKKLTKIGAMDPNEFVVVDLVQVIRKTVSGIETSYPGKPVSVTMNLPESAPTKANRLVEELFINLLSNSVKYDPHDKVEIDIRCDRVSEEGRVYWKVVIADNGTGVPDEKKSLLFQKYLRLKPESEVSGLGLGLSICRALSDKFGGRIWVEDRVSGSSELGAKFVLMLPATKDKKA